MRKIARVLYNISCIFGGLVGIWHFFVPYSFNWFSYIPHAPIEIYQSINYINFCFSFLLSGMSLLLMLVQKKLFEGLKELQAFYLFFVLVWLSRVIVQIIWPWPSSLQMWLVIGFAMAFMSTLIPMMYFFMHTQKKSND